MKHIKKEQGSHLSKINRMISMYKVLTREQLDKAFPELDGSKMDAVLKQLENGGRLVYDRASGMVRDEAGSSQERAVVAAVWVLLDFISSVTYHTVSEYPVTLSFFTEVDAYDVIYVPVEKEIITMHALSGYKAGAAQRLVIVEQKEQIRTLDFPGITAYCMVTPEGKVQYYKKQGVVSG